MFWGFRPTQTFFTHMETSPLPVEGCKFLTYPRHSWPLSREGSSACHTFCDTGHPQKWLSPRTCDTHTYCRAFFSRAVNTCFNDLGLSRLEFEPHTFRLRDECSNQMRHRRGYTASKDKPTNIVHSLE